MMFSILFVTLTLTPFCFGIGNEPPQDPEINDILRQVETLEIGFTRMTQRLKEQEAETATLKKNLKAQKTKTDDLQERLEAQEAAMAAANGTVFFATLSEYQNHIKDQQVIIWDNATINPGGHYNTSTGGYKAPYNGYYQFSVAKTSNQYHALFSINIDGRRYFYNNVFTSREQLPTGTATINLKLRKGQVVAVENNFSNYVFGHTDNFEFTYSFFTGYMIAAL